MSALTRRRAGELFGVWRAGLPVVERTVVRVWLDGHRLSRGQEAVLASALERLREVSGEDDREAEAAGERLRVRREAEAAEARAWWERQERVREAINASLKDSDDPYMRPPRPGPAKTEVLGEAEERGWSARVRIRSGVAEEKEAER